MTFLLRGRAEGIYRRSRLGIPGHIAADLHAAPDVGLPSRAQGSLFLIIAPSAQRQSQHQQVYPEQHRDQPPGKARLMRAAVEVMRRVSDMAVLRLHHITHAADGMQGFYMMRFVNLLPQVAGYRRPPRWFRPDSHSPTRWTAAFRATARYPRFPSCIAAVEIRAPSA